LNCQFEKALALFEYRKEHKEKLRELLTDKLMQYFSSQKVDETINKKRISELEGQLELLEERFVLNQISKEQFEKFFKKYSDEITGLNHEIHLHNEMISNLENAIEKGIAIAGNLRQLWLAASYHDKQRLQYLVFPAGMSYDKKNDQVLTKRVNSLFNEIAVQSTLLGDKEKDNPLQGCLFDSNVGTTRRHDSLKLFMDKPSRR
jgi:hypothetical protein